MKEHTSFTDIHSEFADFEPSAKRSKRKRSIDITEDTERLARELCAFQGYDPDARVFPGRPDTIRTAADQAFVIPEDRLLIRAWQLFEPQALAVRHLKTTGLLG